MEAPVFLPASQILARLLTVDSDSSGLNANRLQGYLAADFALAGHTHSYQPSNANLTALAGLTGAADRLNYFTGVGAMALATFTAKGREVAAAADAAAIRTAAGLGTIATEAAANYAALATINTFALAQTFSQRVVVQTIRPIADGTSGILLQDTSGNNIIRLDTTNRRVGISVAPTFKLHVQESATMLSGTSVASYARQEVQPASASSAELYGIWAIANNAASQTADLTGSLRAFLGTATHAGTGAATSVYGGYTQGVHSGAGTTSTLVGFAAQTVSTNAGGTVTSAYIFRGVNSVSAGTIGTYYGLYLDAITGATTNYAIYTNAGLVRFGDQVQMVAGTTARATVNLPHGVAPTSPVNGDMWTTTAGLFVRINGVTVGPLS